MPVEECFMTNVNNTNYKAIACEQIPELFLDKIVAKKHFSKYGKIKRFILRPKRLSCTIEYENKEDANNAFLNAGNFNGIDFVVRFAEKEVGHVQNTEEWVDPEVQAELEAMSPSHRPDTVLRSALQKSYVIGRTRKLLNNLTFSPKSTKTVSQNTQLEITKNDSAVRQELEDILKSPAPTDEDKYRVLEARDKLIRLATIRQTDIKKAVQTKGSCPDMCPEKERWMREFQRQVSIFEMAEEETGKSTISHRRAIKEYSRSSADQEVPLSHELRSESVLQMTMLYLVHRIMGLCDDPKTSLGEWFHFVWDRTRSIRKDITQQELCSLEAVQLVEQCARFHIHCAARLVAEDPSVFDKKINAENLTKCLQTLKYMYHDLRIKDITCPCEAEFRSYIILLNLGNSNFLWEIKQLPEFIQKSVEIKRAIEFYNALQNNNFVRFFSMIKSPDTSYLSSCILLGYFTNLRIRAMDAIIKSHNWRKNDVYLPLPYLANILGFDNESSAVNFFNHYGLYYEFLDKRVLLDRVNKPNIEYAMDRALLLVESKRQVSVGECVFGKLLPSSSSFENHQPQNSFDDNGIFKFELLTTDGHLMETKFESKHQQKQPHKNLTSPNEFSFFKKPLNLPVGLSKQQKKQHPPEDNIVKEIHNDSLDTLIIKREEIYPSSVIGSTNESNFGPLVLNNKSEQIPCTFSQTEKSVTSFGNIFGVIPKHTQRKSGNIFGIAARETSRQEKDIPEEMFAKANVLREYQRSAENFLPPVTSTEAQSIIFEGKNTLQSDLDDKTYVTRYVTEQSIKKTEEQTVSNREPIQSHMEGKNNEIVELQNLLEERAVQTSELLLNQLIGEELLKLVENEILLSHTIIKASDLQTKLLINEVVKAFVEDIADEEYSHMFCNHLLLKRYFKRWLMHLRKKKEQRKLIENTPLWVTTNSRSEYAQAIKHPCQEKNMEMIKRYRIGVPYDLNQYLNNEYDNLYNGNEIPLNLFAVVGQRLLATQNVTSCGILQQRKYLKFLITLPENNEELLGFGSSTCKWLMRLIEKVHTKTNSFVHGIEHNVALCVRKLSGIIPKNEQGNEMTVEGDHNDGILFFISGIKIDTHSRQRLYNLLKLTKNLKRVPLAIIAYNCKCNREKLAELLDLATLKDVGLICSYTILGCQVKRKDFNFRKYFITAVDFITTESYSSNANEIQALAMQNILPFLETSLGEEMWQRWCVSAKSNPIFNRICNLPEHVLGIYHKALDHLLHITQEDFEEMPEFPGDLKEFVPHNSGSNLPLGLEFFPVNWKDKTEKNLIQSFLRSLYMPLMKQVPAEIEELKIWILKYSSECLEDDDIAATKASHEAITNLVNQIKCLQDFEFCSSVRMINYLTVLKPIIFSHINRMLKQFEKILINLKVIYLKDDLKNYQTQPWWLNYEPLNLVTVDYSEVPLELPQKLQMEPKDGLISTDGMQQIIAEAEEISHRVEKTISKYKRKKQIDCNIPFINLQSSSEIKRTLDQSLYSFELSKKVGQYDTSYVNELTHDIDKSIRTVLIQTHISKQKRKLSPSRKSNKYSEVDNVIAQAKKLVESIEDRECKRKMY